MTERRWTTQAGWMREMLTLAGIDVATLHEVFPAVFDTEDGFRFSPMRNHWGQVVGLTVQTAAAWFYPLKRSVLLPIGSLYVDTKALATKYQEMRNLAQHTKAGNQYLRNRPITGGPGYRPIPILLPDLRETNVAHEEGRDDD